MTKEQKDILLKFKNFVSFRNKFSLLLSLVILVCYYVFVFGIGAFPEILGYRIGDTSITVGIAFGIFIIISCIVTTGLYTFVANQYMDKNQEEILSDIERSGLTQQLQSGELSYNQEEIK
ncbi:MAG: DUF485 domain-containing protein [Campylobacter sp.]|nr:DUF485 domain-containing protein [Campylobacter sp.]